MLRALWFLIKLGLLVAVAVWLAERPGTFEFEWMDYHVRIGTGTALVILLFIFLAALLLHRLVLNIAHLPRRYKSYMQNRRYKKGQRALTLGLTAVAAGDAGTASRHARNASRFLPDDKGLSVLLEGQAARLRGDDEAARHAYHRLLHNGDTAFLGLRALLTDAMESNDFEKADQLVQEALQMHPRQPWLLRTAYELELRRRNWTDARLMLEKAVRTQALPAERTQSDRVALLLQEAEDDIRAGKEKDAFKKLRSAYKYDPAFIPSAARLAGYNLERGKQRAARKIIENTWKQAPHPELALLWHAAMPAKYKKDETGPVIWMEKLYNLNPNDRESPLAVAEEAIRRHQWDKAERYLDEAEALGRTAHLYRLRARMEGLRGYTDAAARLQEKAHEAPGDKVWTCRETGRIYERWAPVATPHGAFNTIVWGYPHELQPTKGLADSSRLLVTAPDRNG